MKEEKFKVARFLPPATGAPAPTPDPIVVIRSLMLTPSRALAKSPGQ